MTPPSVLLDGSFLDALVDRTHPLSEAAHERYAELVDQFERNELRLRARHDHLDRHERSLRRTLLNAVDPVHVASQHHRAAKRLTLPFDVEHDLAVTFVVMRRERIDRVASFDPQFDTLDVVLHR